MNSQEEYLNQSPGEAQGRKRRLKRLVSEEADEDQPNTDAAQDQTMQGADANVYKREVKVRALQRVWPLLD